MRQSCQSNQFDLTIFLTSHAPNKQRCQNYMEQMYEELGKGINPYGLDYPTCLEKKNAEYQHHKQFTADSTITTAGIGPPDNLQQTQEVAYSPQITQLMNHTAVANPPFLPHQDRYRPCADLDLEIYLNRLDVIQAIHANPKTLPWTSCSTSRLQYSKDDVLRPMVDLYKELLEIMNNGEDSDNNLKLLIYSGDDDSICSLAGTQAWIWDLGVSARGRDTWLPWKVHNQTAGFVTRFRMDNPNSSFLFVTVHGAGHEVPSYRPMEALELLKRYLNGKW